MAREEIPPGAPGSDCEPGSSLSTSSWPTDLTVASYGGEYSSLIVLICPLAPRTGSYDTRNSEGCPPIPCDPFIDPFCIGGCDPTVNPFCGIGGGPIFGGGGGGGGRIERPRPFPWPSVPPGFFALPFPSQPGINLLSAENPIGLGWCIGVCHAAAAKDLALCALVEIFAADFSKDCLNTVKALENQCVDGCYANYGHPRPN